MRAAAERACFGWTLLVATVGWAQDPARVRELERAGRHEEAEAEARGLLARREAEAGPSSKSTADALDLLVETLYGGGKGAAEETRLLAARAVRIRDGGDSRDPKLPASLGNLASCLWAAGEYAEARPHLERSVELREKLAGDRSYRLAIPLNNLGHLLLASGDPAAARHVFERTLGLDEGGRPTDAVLAAALHGLGQALLETGDLASARKRIEEALARSAGAESANHRVTLALVLHEMNLEAEAESQLRTVIADIEGMKGNERALATALNNLAWLEHEAGRLDEARPLYSRALSIREEALGPDHPHVAWTLRNLGLLLLERGELGEAETLLDRSLSIRERALGETHPLAGDSLLLRAKVRLAKGDAAKALEDALRAEGLRRERVGLTARYLSEREALSHAGAGGPLRHASRSGSALDVVLACALASGDAASTRRAWDALIRSRALVLDELASRRRALASGDPEVVRRFQALAAAREKLARLFIEEGPGAHGSGRARLERAMAEKDAAERSLGEASAAFRAGRMRALAGFEEVAHALPRGAALVGLARFLVPSGGVASDAVHAAFVAAPGSSDPVCIRLGPAAEIDALATRWHDALSWKDDAVPVEISEREARNAGERLRRRLWDPILRACGAPEMILVVPVGELHLVPFDALPDGEDYLVERGPPIHYLSSERDIISSTAGEAAARGSGLLAFGAPDFGEGSAEAFAAGDLRGIRFEPLPLSSEEAREAAEAWKGASEGGEALLLTGEAATESAFKSLAPGKRAVHLATHGFFLGSGATASPAGSRGVGGLAPTREGAAGAIDPSPLLLSGVAFAGANRRGRTPGARDDGILTAEEIAGLDLSTVEWAVLSACDTGAGKLDVSEGVLGLRRAFQAAGARTLITSLWSVEDNATREWMQELYRARFGEGLGTAEAARKASRNVLALRRAEGRSTHPFYWAGFVAAGDWK